MYDVGFLLGFCYSSSWLIGIACVLHLMYKYTRKFLYVTVNCWFCNIDCKVPWNKKNDWNCMNCDQFNGFNKEGNYNKVIKEQFNEELNTKCSRPYSYHTNYTSKSNGLCRICNANQELKIRQLAIYEPFKEENYDEEIEIFKERLEKSYKLCCICEETVQKTLRLKSDLFSEVVDNALHKKKSLTEQNRSTKKWKAYVYCLFFPIVILMASFWKYGPSKTDLMDNELFKNFFSMDLVSLTENSGIFIDMIFFLCITVVMKMKNPNFRIFGRLLIFAVFIYGIRNYLPLILKISLIVTSILYVIIRIWRKRNVSVKCQKLSDDFRNRMTDVEEDDTPVQDNVFVNNPFCGKFSSMSLGRSSTVARPKISPYLFRSTKSIIQPSRLKLDESERCETPRSSQTTSSGYESVANYLKRSPDSISEFDSVSQIGEENRRSPFDFKWQYDQKNESIIAATRNKSLYTFGGDSGLLSPYQFSRNQCFSLSDQYYGVSPAFSPNQSSQIQRNTFFSALPLILCSLVFFILGFSLQLFINKVLL